MSCSVTVKLSPGADLRLSIKAKGMPFAALTGMSPLNLKLSEACAVHCVGTRSRAFLDLRSDCLKVFIGSCHSGRRRACFSASEYMKCPCRAEQHRWNRSWRRSPDGQSSLGQKNVGEPDTQWHRAGEAQSLRRDHKDDLA